MSDALPVARRIGGRGQSIEPKARAGLGLGQRARGADPGDAAALAEAVCELFGLEPQEQPDDDVAQPPPEEQSSGRKAQA